MKRTSHATARAQQRGIPPIVVDLLLRFGQIEHDHAGAEILYFDRRSKRRVESYVGALFGKLSEHLDSYAVVANGQIVTVGVRYNRINHS